VNHTVKDCVVNTDEHCVHICASKVEAAEVSAQVETYPVMNVLSVLPCKCNERESLEGSPRVR
jgi:hypothetical protein